MACWPARTGRRRRRLAGGSSYGVRVRGLRNLALGEPVAVNAGVVLVAVEAVAVVLTVVAPRAELTAPQALVDASDDGVRPARRAGLRRDGVDRSRPSGRLAGGPRGERSSGKQDGCSAAQWCLLDQRGGDRRT